MVLEIIFSMITTITSSNNNNKKIILTSSENEKQLEQKKEIVFLYYSYTGLYYNSDGESILKKKHIFKKGKKLSTHSSSRNFQI